jgi:hypothetical protein
MQAGPPRLNGVPCDVKFCPLSDQKQKLSQNLPTINNTKCSDSVERIIIGVVILERVLFM